ncbi:hypothetical protein N7448_008203 [Penicillium atrosanguineum]|uniref:DUF3074 domain-containing protein n=1 Tax=Penicillium atrosanguineum TaxID=1132637 RepID=A0A9W9GR51_9EURO|nr:uncharacterized protein N7443_000782 [Penicillium atrosanguineum]KAJ5127424.1 hypothetical protein N7448_008203 [Penicillium atrosanguineum]KAJ5147628.1 hypothetical protein N7526_000980 [Penicillium atrosanguineum]KAJ5313898.1 hypothetical protein N7443_000782 [Penicillium atrosanguineum]KAJ5331069.1 hypothetical protein N7476_000852 [Penicillium atrosanguineum]
MPFVQLQPHPFTIIPSHPSLSTETSRADPKQFVATALREAIELLHSIPSTFKTDPKPRASPPSQAKVNLMRGWRNSDEEKSEFWVARQSKHVDASDKGTASWGEFEAGLRTNHAEHEMEYTPSVSGVERLLEWSGEDIGEVEVDDITYKDVVFEINIITHSFHPSALISPRSFISLTISAAYNSPTQSEQQTPLKGFITVQVPLSSDPSSTPSEIHQKITSSAPRRAIFANYASVERVSILPTEPNSIEWTMATTSDAGGSIPQWVQRNWTLGGVPRAVVADVGLFVGWTMRQRGSS